MKKKRIMVDMSVTLLHHGHVRLLEKAASMGRVIVALTTDAEVRKYKGYRPELNWEQRKEILQAIRHVDEVVPSPWVLTDAFLDSHRIDRLVHAGTNSNKVASNRLVALPRTRGISSRLMRARATRNLLSGNQAQPR